MNSKPYMEISEIFTDLFFLLGILELTMEPLHANGLEPLPCHGAAKATRIAGEILDPWHCQFAMVKPWPQSK